MQVLFFGPPHLPSIWLALSLLPFFLNVSPPAHQFPPTTKSIDANAIHASIQRLCWVHVRMARTSVVELSRYLRWVQGHNYMSLCA